MGDEGEEHQAVRIRVTKQRIPQRVELQINFTRGNTNRKVSSRLLYYFFRFDENTKESNAMTTNSAPAKVIYLPENSLPNSIPSPMPPMIPTNTPTLFITLCISILFIKSKEKLRIKKKMKIK